MLRRAQVLVLIAVGGLAGAVCRHALTVAVPGGFPWGTLAANALGSLALGFLLYENRIVGVITPETRLVLGTGFLSSFTTYSTFALETTALAPTAAALNVGANYALALLGVLVGRAGARVVA